MEVQNEHIFEKFNRLKYLTKRILKERNDIFFMKDCKYFNLTPKFLKVRNWYINSDFKKEARVFEMQIMNKTIRKKYGIIGFLKQEADSLKLEMKEYVNMEDLDEMLNRIDYFAEKDSEKQRIRHNKKLKYWIEKYKIKFRKNNEEIHVPYINLSKFTPTNTQDRLLKLGPKFVIEQPINLNHTIAKIETAIKYLPSDVKLECRSLASKELKLKMKENNNNKYEIKELKNLKNNPDINCIETDKTGKIAILDKDNYIQLMEQAINKLNVKILKKDPINGIIKKVDALIKNNNWPNSIKPSKNSAPVTPRIFGKLKDHKQPVTIRPIVNKIESPTYPIEKLMKKVYQELLPPSEKSINSTQDLINIIKNQEIEKDVTLISLDIKDMYPSIDIYEIGNIIEQKIKNHYINQIETQNILISATNLLLRSSVFQYNNVFYQQMNGLPMGSPISGVIAELKIRDLEEKITEDLKENIILWIRYVDDVFAIIKNTTPDTLLEKINKFDNNIKFTYESEINNKINYLDVSIIKDNSGKLKTTVYRKPTANNNIINKKSLTPYRYKTSVLTALINRAFNICSDESLFKKEIRIIEDIAKNAGYKKELIEKIVKKRRKKLNIIDNAQKPKGKFTTSIPFNKGMGEIIHRAASKNNIQIPIKPDKNILQIIKKDRDKIDHRETSGIYKINFIDKYNNSKAYIGVTERRIRTRVNEHKIDIEKNRVKSALTQMEDVKKLKIDFENPIKIANYENYIYAYKRESIEILANKNTCNKMDHSTVPAVWKNWFLDSGDKSNGEISSNTPDDDTEEVLKSFA